MDFERDGPITAIRAMAPGTHARVAGRIAGVRRHGALEFGTLSDDSGRIQLMAERPVLGPVRRGDWIGATGVLTVTRTGELTLAAEQVLVLAPGRRTMETRARARTIGRHADLLAEADARRTLDVRMAVLASLRSTLARHGFGELDAGPDLRPLIVGGYERVFSFDGQAGRLRLRACQTFVPPSDMAEILRQALHDAALAANATAIDLDAPWRTVTIEAAITEFTGEWMRPDMPLEAARGTCEELGVPFSPDWSVGPLMRAVFHHRVRPRLHGPTIVFGFPRQQHAELVVKGTRLARIEALRTVPEDEHDTVLEYGLPPTSALTLDVDRLVMVLSEAGAVRDATAAPRAPRARRRRGKAPEESWQRRRAPRALGAAIALIAALVLLWHLRTPDGGQLVTVLAATGLVLLGGQLCRGKRRAWSAAVAFTSGAAAAAIVAGAPVEGAAMTGLLVALVWHRHAFDARSDPLPSRRLLLVRAVVLATGTGILMLDRHDPREAYAAGVGGFVVLGWLVLGAVRAPGHRNAPDRARAMIAEHGDGTLDGFASREDRRHFFARGDDAFLAYSLVAGTALVAGDPIGAPDARRRVVREFLAHCRTHGWAVAFVGVRDADLPLYRAHGLRATAFGHEHIAEGRPMEGLNGCRHRLVRNADLTPAMRAALPGHPLAPDAQSLLALALGHDERPVAYLLLVASGGRRPGWALASIHRTSDTPDHVIGSLIETTATELTARGFGHLSLGYAPFARLPPARGHGATHALARWVGHRLSPETSFVTERFATRAVGRAMVVEHLSTVPKVTMLYAIVERRHRLARSVRLPGCLTRT